MLHALRHYYYVDGVSYPKQENILMQLTHFHNKFLENDFKSATEYLDSFDWNLSFHPSGDKWVLIAGDQLLATFDSQKELEAFVFGLALGFAVLPDEVVEHLWKIIGELIRIIGQQTH